MPQILSLHDIPQEFVAIVPSIGFHTFEGKEYGGVVPLMPLVRLPFLPDEKILKQSLIVQGEEVVQHAHIEGFSEPPWPGA